MNTVAKEEGRVIEVAAESFSRREDRALPALVEPGQATPMSMLAMAVKQGMSIETIKELRALQKEWDADEARKAFVTALSAFKADPPELFKNKHVSYANSKGGKTEYDHATLDQVASEIGRKLSPHGLSFRWNTEQKEGGMVRVTCVLMHSRGHSESIWLESGRDESGGKNNIQALGSVVTYLERYTLLAITGMAVRDQDDDGRDSEKKKEVEPDAEGKAKLEACGSMAALAEAWKALTAAQRATLAEVKNECKTRIQEADKAAG
jgi:hypothetical protein